MKITFNADDLLEKIECMIEEDYLIMQLDVEDEYSGEATITAINTSGEKTGLGTIELMDDTY